MGGSTLAQVAAGTGSCEAGGIERSGVNGSGGNQNGAETNTSGIEKQTATSRGEQRAAGKQRACMWYARRHKNDATAGGAHGSEAKEVDRLRIQLRKTREGLANLIRDVDESLGEQPSGWGRTTGPPSPQCRRPSTSSPPPRRRWWQRASTTAATRERGRWDRTTGPLSPQCRRCTPHTKTPCWASS